MKCSLPDFIKAANLGGSNMTSIAALLLPMATFSIARIIELGEESIKDQFQAARTLRIEGDTLVYESCSGSKMTWVPEEPRQISYVNYYDMGNVTIEMDSYSLSWRADSSLAPDFLKEACEQSDGIE